MASTRYAFHEWADLPPDLLGSLISRLPLPDDRARFRAVCRSWQSAVREHARPDLPWIIHADGTFVNYGLGFHRRAPFPDDIGFVGVNGNWLALYHTGRNGRHSYLLHNPFTKASLPLPGLDSVIGKMVSSLFKVRKVLMRSDQDNLVVVTTNNTNCPVILYRAGPEFSGARGETIFWGPSGSL
ncbi:hypothetical protein ZWY2020_017218 [Hordeum vulgare]|nr:hypothetical protein ZWY2020_017218 [Hordeum vulgare]